MIAIVTNHHEDKIFARHGNTMEVITYNGVLSEQSNALQAARLLANKLGLGYHIATGKLDEGVYVGVFSKNK